MALGSHSIHRGLRSGQCSHRGEEERALGARGVRSLENLGVARPQRVFPAMLQKQKLNLMGYVTCLTFFSFSSLPSFFLSLLSFLPLFSLAPFSQTPFLRPSPALSLYFFTHRKIKTNYFIVSLAFADLLVSVRVMPFGAIELVQDIWIYGEMFCLVRTSLDVLLTTASIFHLCCISLDR